MQTKNTVNPEASARLLGGITILRVFQNGNSEWLDMLLSIENSGVQTKIWLFCYMESFLHNLDRNYHQKQTVKVNKDSRATRDTIDEANTKLQVESVSSRFASVSPIAFFLRFWFLNPNFITDDTRDCSGLLPTYLRWSICWWKTVYVSWAGMYTRAIHLQLTRRPIYQAT